MENFVFQNPVKILFGKDVLTNTGTEAACFSKRALLVSGRTSAKKQGVYKTVVDSLNDCGVTITEYAGIRPNPDITDVERGIARARQDQVGLIIAVGGGSVIDCAKAIAAGVPVAHTVWKFFTGKKSVQDSLPLITIPTVAGSGSETNSGMVLSDREKKQKLGFAHRKLFPKVCISEPATTFTVPPDQTAYGAVDTFCHCLEAYLTTEASGITFQFGMLETLFKSIMDSCPRVLRTPDSYDNRATLLWCAANALSGLPVAGLGRIAFPLHIIEHGITTIHDISHGAGLAALLPGWLFFHRHQFSARLEALGLSLTGDRHGAISSINTFLKDINCPCCLSDIAISEDHYQHIIEHSLYQARIWRFKGYSEERINAILKTCQHPLEQ